MRMLVLAFAVLMGCIPMKKTFIMRPGGTIQVVDAKGAPIASASVTLTRNKYPYGREDAQWHEKTDAKGEVSFTREENTQTVFPLMMHGVPGYGFVACAEAPGYAGKSGSWMLPEEGPQPPLVLKLAQGDRPCVPPKGELTAPPKGNARVLGVERTDPEQGAEQWKLELVLPKDEPVAIGVTLGGMKLTKIEWQSAPINEWLRATVVARGPGEKVHFGELLARE